jgi:hypothetical protein
MGQIHIRSIRAPFDDAARARHAVRILATAEAMGLLVGLDLQELDLAGLRAVLDRLAAAGIGREAQAELAAAKGPVDYDALLARLDEALAMSPVPEAEWQALGRLFESEDLAGLLNIAPASVRRYRAGARPTPDAVAARLHFLAGVVGDLAGAYNAYGIRRWFQRPRAQLGGRSPAQVLAGEWDPFAPEAQGVRALAGALTDAGAT